jgi:hypothetical protein
VPTLHVAGWYDQEDFYGPLKTYDCSRPTTRKMKTSSSSALESRRLAVGSGDKLGKIDFGSDTGKHFRAKVQAPFFARYLKDKGEKPPKR